MIALMVACSSSAPQGGGELAVPDLGVPGPSVVLSGTVASPVEGQVRFLEDFGGSIEPVCIATLSEGRFTAEAPLNNTNPVYVAATSPDGRWSALPDPVVVTDQDITVSLGSEVHPAWAEGLGLDRLVVYERELRRGAPPN